MTLKIVSSYNGVSDPDAAAYISAVEAADGELLEFAVGKAINDFVLGCKADGVWDAIKASCILAGARTLAGALVPLVGAVPTNNGFVAGNYNRKTGLSSAGTTSYISTNRSNNSDPQNSKHACVFQTEAPISAPSFATWYWGDLTDTIQRQATTDTCIFRNRNGVDVSAFQVSSLGLKGTSRGSSSAFTYRSDGVSATATLTSYPPSSGTEVIFTSTYNNTPGSYNIKARLAFYSIGEDLDLALLEARVTDLINAFGAAIL